MIYERLWRPVLFFGFHRAQHRPRRPAQAATSRVAARRHRPRRRLRAGQHHPHPLAAVGSDGLAVGVDSSATMLAQAVRDTAPGSPVGYVRADAVDLPFDDGTVDAVSCYGALYLMDDPFGALREMIRVLTPGGRIAVLTTCARGPAPVRRASVAASRFAPLRLFDVDEVVDVMRAAGLVDVIRDVSAASQTVSARRP